LNYGFVSLTPCATDSPTQGSRKPSPTEASAESDRFGGFHVALDKTSFVEGPRREPALAHPPPFAAAPEANRLDPSRHGFWPPTPMRRRPPLGPFGSLLLHVLPLLAIVEWARVTIPVTAPIPIKLVIEEPPAPPPAPAVTPAPGRHASEDLAEVAAPKLQRGVEMRPAVAQQQHAAPAPDEAEAKAAASPRPAEPPPQPPEAASTAAPPPPSGSQVVLVAPPLPIPKLPAAPDPPAAPVEAAPPPRHPPHKQTAAMRMPEALGAEWPLPLHPERGRPLPHAAPRLGPASTRDEYCALMLRMTLRHIDLLPLSYVGSRSGETVLAIRVLGDGTINSVRVVRGSGYPGIDERVEKMVFAVGHFPPLPSWIPGRFMDFTFNLHFPHPLMR